MPELEPELRIVAEQAELRRRVQAIEEIAAAHDRSIGHLFATLIDWLEGGVPAPPESRSGPVSPRRGRARDTRRSASR